MRICRGCDSDEIATATLRPWSIALFAGKAIWFGVRWSLGGNVASTRSQGDCARRTVGRMRVPRQFPQVSSIVMLKHFENKRFSRLYKSYDLLLLRYLKLVEWRATSARSCGRASMAPRRN